MYSIGLKTWDFYSRFFMNKNFDDVQHLPSTAETEMADSAQQQGLLWVNRVESSGSEHAVLDIVLVQP